MRRCGRSERVAQAGTQTSGTAQVAVSVPSAYLTRPLKLFIADEGPRVCREKALAGFVSVFDGTAKLDGDLPMEYVCQLSAHPSSAVFVAQTETEKPPGRQVAVV